MRIPVAATLFASLFVLPVASARATGIDDFTLTGEGHTITYSLPASAVVMDHPHGVTLSASSLATIDGVPGYAVSGLYYVFFLPGLPDIVLTVPPFIDGGQLVLYGQIVLSYTVIPIVNPTFTHPDDLLVTFVPGTYSLSTRSITLAPPAQYTLTITPESTATPEPSSLLLLATGACAAGGAVRSRLRRRTPPRRT